MTAIEELLETFKATGADLAMFVGQMLEGSENAGKIYKKHD